MSKVIEFLAALGADARLRDAGQSEIDTIMIQSDIGPELRAAILAGDQEGLETLLGAKTNVCCMVHAPEDDEEEEGDDPAPDEDDEDPAARQRVTYRDRRAL
jgi:hypothetical protein